MSGGGQGASRATVSQVEADLAAAREEIAGLRAELAELREQVGEHAVVLAHRLERRRRQLAADK